MVSKTIKAYLEYLGLKSKFPIQFVTTNDLAQMSFCPNKVYIKINFVGGLTYYSESLLEAMRLPPEEKEERIKKNEIIKDMLKKVEFKRWEIGEDSIKSYLIQEIWSYSHLENSLKLFPGEVYNIRLKISGLPTSIKKQIEAGVFHSRFRTNFTFSPFFLSSVPDIVIISEKKIRGIIELKSSRKVYRVFPSEHDQIEFYRLYTYKRKLPLLPDPFFITIKYNRRENPNFEDDLVKFIHKDITVEDLEEFVRENNGLLKESTSSLYEIESRLGERIKMLSSPKYPIIKQCPWKPCPFTWFDRNKGVNI